MPDIARPLQVFASMHSLKPAACYFGLVFGMAYLLALVLFALMPATLAWAQARSKL